jgi:O-antigen ligase
LIAGAAALLVSMIFPSFTVLCLILLAIPGFLPAEVLELNPLPALFPVDLIVLIMGGATIIKYMFFSKHKSADLKYLFLLILLFGAYFLFEIGRNYAQYGLSAPGEVRFRYFYLIPPLYIALLFDTEKSRISLLKVLIFASLFLGLLVFYTSFLFDVQAAFQYSHITAGNMSIGIVYGFVALYISWRYGLLKSSAIFLLIVGTAVFISIVLDQHRSVWLVCIALIAILIYKKELPVTKLAWFIYATVAIVVVFFLVYAEGATSYFGIRALALTNPEQDPNTYWRMVLAQASIDNFWQSPIMGEGFGGHWDLLTPEFGANTTVAPHNFYIMTLVKMGIVGLMLYFAIVFTIWRRLAEWMKLEGDSKEFPIVLAASMIFFLAQVFNIAYGLEYYAWIFIGLGMAVVRNSEMMKYENSAS